MCKYSFASDPIANWLIYCWVYRLASFGGAGGQHACEIAAILGIKTILIHRYSSILSAYGLALADRAYELQEPCSTFYNPGNAPTLVSRLDRLSSKVRSSLLSQGFEPGRIKVERMLNMRFEGTDTALMVIPDEKLDLNEKGEEDFERAFKRKYKSEFGFLLDAKNIIVDDVKVRFFHAAQFIGSEESAKWDVRSVE